MTHLRSICLRNGSGNAELFPFSVPAIRTLPLLPLDAPVTFFVGENGSGKSTLLEALALAARLPTIGSIAAGDDATLAPQRALANALKLVWSHRAQRGFFLRAEDFFGFTKQLSQMRADFLEQLAAIDVEYREKDRSEEARGLARLPIVRSLRDMEQRYGIDLDANSHGQSFLRLFQSRFVPDGLYLLDEPEAPLSPQSQLALLAMLSDMIAKGGQFIIATHSPILLGFPGAQIYTFDAQPVARAEYETLEHVALTREFLNDPARFLRHLTD